MDTGAFLYDGDMKSVLSAPRRTAQSKGTDFVRGTSARKARKDDVFDLLDKNFDRFDRNGDLRVTWPEMRKSVADPLIQGKDDGVFELSFAEYARDFGRFSFQTTTPTTRA